MEDTSGGIHDTLMAACDRYRYEVLGCTDYHDNCTDNLARACATSACRRRRRPSPLNLFMNIPWTTDGGLSFAPPVSTPGSYVVLRAEMDLVIAFSACPQDILPINGQGGQADRGAFPGGVRERHRTFRHDEQQPSLVNVRSDATKQSPAE